MSDALGVLFFVAVVFGVLFILPIVALVQARAARREAEDLGRRLQEITLALAGVREKLDRLSEPRATTPAPAAGAPAVAPIASAREVYTDAGPAIPPIRPGWTLTPPPEPAPAADRVTEPVLPPAPEPAPAASARGWEMFAGARLFAWVGGLALFLGVAFLFKHSVDQGLISPAVRVALGFLAGTAAIVAGLHLDRAGYRVVGYTLAAAGPALLYAATFAAHNLYGFLGTGPTFLAMVVWTTGSFVLAVRLDARYIAVLGLVSGFLTPPLISTGVDNPLGLFGYVTLLDIGLAAVALRQGWSFLVALSAAGSALTALGWAAKFFAVPGAATACAVFLWFPILYAALAAAGERWRRAGLAYSVPAGLFALLSVAFTGYLLSFSELAARPGLVLGYLLAINAVLAARAIARAGTEIWLHLGGALSFALLAVWTVNHLHPGLLSWALGFYLAFALLHAALPVALQQLRPASRPAVPGAIFPLLMLLLVVLPLTREMTAPALLWPVVLAIDAAGIAAAVAAGALWAILGAMLLTLLLGGVWILSAPDLGALSGQLGLVAALVVTFFALGVWLNRRRDGASAAGGAAAGAGAGAGVLTSSDPLRQLPALSALLPFLLLSLVCARLELTRPTPVFALALLLVGLLLGLVRKLGADPIALVTLAALASTELSWQRRRFDPADPLPSLLWYAVFLAVFLLFPFLDRRMRERRLPWMAAAAAGPVQFLLLHDAASRAFGPAYIGALPAILAIVYLVALVALSRLAHADPSLRQSQLAYFGGVTLFFVCVIFPLQLDKEWVTIGWATVGAALVWLHRRLPHPGLKLWGGALLAIAFARLAVNPAVLRYHPRSGTPVWNWYLYAYGSVFALCLAAARLWRPPEERLRGLRPAALLDGLAGVLLFLLVNIEISDYFSSGATIAFQFGGNLARDMAYSLAWALFGLGLLVIAIHSGRRGPRVASTVLLAVTVLKLFLHDLWRLGGLYRVGAFVGLALVLILVSFLYQRYLAASGRPPAPGREEASDG